jgi:hypothetical protein
MLRCNQSLCQKSICRAFLVAGLSAPILGATGTGHSSGHAESWQDPAHQDDVSDKNYNEP